MVPSRWTRLVLADESARQESGDESLALQKRAEPFLPHGIDQRNQECKDSHDLNTGMILSGSSIFDEELSLEQVKVLLSRMNRDRVLEICSRLNLRNRRFALALGGWHNEQGAQALERLYAEFFKPNFKRREAFLAECKHKNCTPFSEVALNALFCLACAFCNENGGDQMCSVDRKHNLMRVLLAIQNKVSPVAAMTVSLSEGKFEEVFPLVGRSILANRCLQNIWEFDLGRLFAFATEPLIGKQLVDRSRITVDDFFMRFAGMPTIDYQIMFSCLWQYALTTDVVDIDLFTKQFKENQAAFLVLINNATATPVKVASTLKDARDLEDAIFLSDTLITDPLIDIQTRRLVPSCSLLFNKFLRGFPYLALQSQAAPDEVITDSEAKKRGADFGHILEGYLIWLMRQWFDHSEVQVIENYEISPGRTTEGWRQGDLVLIYHEVAIALEISTSRLRLSFRKTGSLDECVKGYSRVTEQAYSRAMALIEGRAFHNDRKTPLPKVTKAFPCAVVFEFMPFAQPFVIPFEKRMAEEGVKADSFDDSETIGPLQYFDVQQIEEWDEIFNLPGEIAALFAAIRERANSQCFRYQSISSVGGSAGHGGGSRLGVVRKKCTASVNGMQERIGKITHK